MKKLLLSAAFAAAIAGCPGLAAAEDCTITIGLDLELTGPAGAYGVAGAKSVEMALRDFNDAGGANGCKIVTDTRDSQTQGNVAVDQATQLVNIKKVPLVIGG
ncbi:ABC transporter substrate-binding protein, partial [Aestuariivirga sp.]|uniref:ABC transporter substrate-binding protein n=1 Tax=Aestuariivirga sp. TaxID=2650926 RepID=UPI0039E38827